MDAGREGSSRAVDELRDARTSAATESVGSGASVCFLLFNKRFLCQPWRLRLIPAEAECRRDG